MPVGSYAPNKSTAAAGATVFPYTFKIFDKAHLQVTVDGVVKTEGSDYTVDGVGSASGGNVTFGTPLAGGESVVRERVVPYVRDEDYQPNGSFKEENVDRDIDLRTMQIQQIAELVGRALRAPVGFPLSDLPTPEAAKFLQWKTDLSGLQNTDIFTLGAISATSFAQTLLDDASAAEMLSTLGALRRVDTIAALKALTPGAHTWVMVMGYYATGDNGGGVFYWDAASTETDNGGTIIAPDAGGTGRWKRVYTDTVTVLQFGAKGDGATDDKAAIQAAITWATANRQHVHLPGWIASGTEAVYLCKSQIAVPANRTFKLTMTGGHWHFHANIGSASGLLFDSCMMSEVDIQGEVVYAGTGSAVEFRPANNVPVDSVTTCADSKFKINTIVNTNTSSSTANVEFDPAIGPIQNCVFEFLELNGEGAIGGGGITAFGILVAEPGTGSFNDNRVRATHIHHHNSASVQLGVNTTNAAAIARNGWDVNCSPNATKDGFNTFAVKQFGVVNVDEEVGTPGNGIVFQATADNCIFTSIEMVGGINHSASTSKENKVFLKATRQQNGMSVGASPYTYQNQSALTETVIVQSGTVSDISFSVDNSTFYSTGLTQGQFTLEPGDALKVTYSAAPGMNKFF